MSSGGTAGAAAWDLGLWDFGTLGLGTLGLWGPNVPKSQIPKVPKALMKASWRIWPQESAVFHVKGGARLGQPGKETIVMKITFAGSMLSLFALPMELGVKF